MNLMLLCLLCYATDFLASVCFSMPLMTWQNREEARRTGWVFISVCLSIFLSLNVTKLSNFLFWERMEHPPSFFIGAFHKSSFPLIENWNWLSTFIGFAVEVHGWSIPLHLFLQFFCSSAPFQTCASKKSSQRKTWGSKSLSRLRESVKISTYSTAKTIQPPKNSYSECSKQASFSSLSWLTHLLTHQKYPLLTWKNSGCIAVCQLVPHTRAQTNHRHPWEKDCHRKAKVKFLKKLSRMNLLIDFLHCEEYALKCKVDQNCFSAQTLLPSSENKWCDHHPITWFTAQTLLPSSENKWCDHHPITWFTAQPLLPSSENQMMWPPTITTFFLYKLL